MISLLEDFPLALIAPTLVSVAWLIHWIVGRPAGWKFFLSATGVAVLSIPTALLISLIQRPCYNPDHETWACGYSSTLTSGVLSALLTAGCVAALLLLTTFLRAFGLGPNGKAD